MHLHRSVDLRPNREQLRRALVQAGLVEVTLSEIASDRLARWVTERLDAYSRYRGADAIPTLFGTVAPGADRHEITDRRCDAMDLCSAERLLTTDQPVPATDLLCLAAALSVHAGDTVRLQYLL